MRWFYLLAGLVTLATGAVHAIMGGIDVLNPLLAAKADMTAKAAIMALWHAHSLFFALSAIAFFWAFAAGRTKARPLGVFLGLFFIGYGAIFAAISLLWFEDVTALPQWTMLIPIGLLSLIASL
jgi:hypothetical protein